MRYFLFLIFLINSGFGYSQDIAVYVDTLNSFFVFDAGPQKKIESLSVQNYKTGRNIIAYQDHVGNLKIYYKGKITFMCDSVREYIVSNCFVTAISNSQLKLFDNGKIKTLTTGAVTYTIADSLVAFHDNTEKKFKVYYKGKTKDLEKISVSNQITNFKASGNILAYIDTLNDLKMFYHGRIATLFSNHSSLPLQYEVGQDVVAYINNDSHSFNIHWSGKNYKVEDSIPASVVAGCNYVAYVDHKGIFKIFSEGRVTIITKTRPDIYKIADDIIAYSEKNIFKAYYKGTSYPLEKYIPGSYKCDKGALAYTDKTGALFLFINGKKETVTTDVITDFSLNGNLLKYSVGKRTWIFYKGTTY